MTMDEKKLNDLLGSFIASLTDEQREKAKACKDLNELTALLGNLGVPLPDELLDEAAGGVLPPEYGIYFAALEVANRYNISIEEALEIVLKGM